MHLPFDIISFIFCEPLISAKWRYRTLRHLNEDYDHDNSNDDDDDDDDDGGGGGGGGDDDDDDDDDDGGDGGGGGVGDDAGAAAADDDDYDDRTLNLPRNFFFMSTGNSKNTSQKFLMTG